MTAFVTLEGGRDGDDALVGDIRELGDVTTLRDPDVMSALGDKIKERQAEED